MHLKAVSPLVAVVLLISITLLTGVVITLWVKSFTSKYTSLSPIECALNAQYAIDSAEYDSARKEISVRVTNKGKIDLSGFSLILDNSTDIREVNSTSGMLSFSPDISRSNRLKIERSVIIKANAASGHELARTLKSIKVLNEVCAEVSASTESIVQR
ncbi:MAG: hypothetical protein HYX24_06065 [Candidatus Aenigmarchaeota archaeon]|nr:hypothetical protein [Candidatus Aenigmarchaeota archaeon]